MGSTAHTDFKIRRSSCDAIAFFCMWHCFWLRFSKEKEAFQSRSTSSESFLTEWWWIRIVNRFAPYAQTVTDGEKKRGKRQKKKNYNRC
jgi:hypothetical protein